MAGIQVANLAGMFRQGQQDSREDRNRGTLSKMLQPALGGDQDALAAVYGASPEMGMKVQEFAGTQRASAKDEFGKLSAAVASTKNPQMLGQWVKAGQAAGVLPAEGAPDFNDPADLEGAFQAAQAYAQAYGGAQQQSPAAIQELQYLLANPDARKLDMERRQAGWQPKVLNTADGYALLDPRTRDVAPLEYGGGQPPQQQGGDMFASLGNIPGVQVTSGQRSPEKNAKVGGVANSYHLTNQARDIVPPQTPEQAQAVRQWADANGMEVIDEGDHWHMEPRGQQGGGRRVMPAPKQTSQFVPLSSDEIKLMGLPAGSVAQRNLQTGQVSVISKPPASAGSKPMPVSALKLVQDSQEKLSIAQGNIDSLSKIGQQIQSGQLDLGLLANTASRARNFVGASTPESRNFALMNSSLEKLRNDSLRLNNGVQTEGDAQRAWNELMNNLNDEKVVSDQIVRIIELNKRAERLHQENVERVNANYGAGKQAGQEQEAANDIEALLEMY